MRPLKSWLCICDALPNDLGKNDRPRFGAECPGMRARLGSRYQFHPAPGQEIATGIILRVGVFVFVSRGDTRQRGQQESKRNRVFCVLLIDLWSQRSQDTGVCQTGGSCALVRCQHPSQGLQNDRINSGSNRSWQVKGRRVDAASILRAFIASGE